ncbi:MAG TPA: tyrosine-type recombinase/integrase [Bryobacteraceae bacterium]|nr:tyrosine-type recombinase/integrase [Bryobacteraceae bacterium]
MLTPYRRHLTSTDEKGKPLCPHAAKGRAYTKCSCPIWADGKLHGQRYRKPVKTPGGGTVRDWNRAIRLIAALEDPEAPRVKPISEAVEAFEQHCSDLAPATQYKFKNVLRRFAEHCKAAKLNDLSDVGLEHLDAFRTGRNLSPIVSLKELEMLRRFFGFCVKRKWVAENVAAEVETPRNIKPNEVVPYTADDIRAMVKACDEIGQWPYERLRARALVLLLRHTGLRITDAITLGRDRIRDGQLLLHTQKTGGRVHLPVAPELQAALDALPAPRGAGEQPRYFFWNGIASKRAAKGIAERTLATVFQKSEVAKAHAHRFRHTLATDILSRGGTEQDAADVLGISPAIVRKHYGKWSQARQDRIASIMKAVQSGTSVARVEKVVAIR